MRKANIAVIGCGNLAQSQHISNLIKSKKSNLCCFCDVNESTLKDLAKRFPHVPTESDYKKVLSNPDIDGVVIATREEEHVPLTIEALNAGKYVYVEKPLAETSEDCQKVVEAEKKSGKRVLVGMNRRLAPSYRDAKGILERNGGMKAAYYRIADPFALDWGRKMNIMGKRIIIECCHIIDILRYFADSEVKTVYCYSSRPDEDNVLLQFENGSSAMMLGSGYVPRETPKEHFEATTEEGFVTVDDFCELHSFGLPGEVECKYYEGHSHVEHDYLQAQWYKNEGLKADIAVRKFLVQEEARAEKAAREEGKPVYSYHEPYLYYINYGVDKGWFNALEHFADVILEGVPVEAATAEDAYKAAKIIDAIIESREKGILVDVK